MTTIRNLDVNLDGFSDYNTTYGTGSWDEVGWQNSLSIYDNSGADLFNANVDLSDSDWTIRSMNVGASLGSTLYLNDLDDGTNRTIKALFIGGSSIVNLSTTNIGHLWGGGDSQEVNLGSGSVRNIDLHATKNTISTGSGFIMGISTAGLSYIDVAEGCGIGSIFTDYGSEVHITLHDQSFVDYIQVCGENSSIEFNGYVDVASVRLEGASISVGDGYVGSILNYAGGGLISVDSGSVGSIQSWNDGMTIQLGTGANIGTIQSSENGMHVKTNGSVKLLSATGDLGGNEIVIDKEGWVQDIRLEGEANQVVVSGGAGNVHTGSGNDVVTVNSGGRVDHIDLGDGNNEVLLDGTVEFLTIGNGNNAITLADNSRLVTLVGSSGGIVANLIGDSRILQLKLGSGENIVTTDTGNIESYYSYGGNNTLNIGVGGVQQIVLSGDGTQSITSDGFIGSLQCYGNSSSTVFINGGALSVLTAKGDDGIILGNGQWIGQLFTWDGNDIVTMGVESSIDTCNLDAGDDIFQFNTVLANDFDLIRGGDGRDLADFSQVAAGVTISMNLNGAGQVLGAGQVGVVGFEDLTGSTGVDRLEGSDEANEINGLAGSDRIFGLGGNDTLDGGAGNDTLTGGDGADTSSYGSATGAVTVNLSLTSAQNTSGAGTDTLATFENLVGSAFNDKLNGDANANRLSGGAGNDTLTSGVGNDTLEGGTGKDKMYGGAGDDTYVCDSSTDFILEFAPDGTDLVLSSAATYALSNNIENLTLTGSSAINGTGNTLSNLLTGNSGANSIFGGGGNDTIISGAGNDTVEGAAGNDSLTGGDGIDTASYSGAAAAVMVNLTLKSAQYTRGAGTDTLTTIENLIGSAYNDTLTGDANANSLSGGAGDDTIYAGSGNDVLSGAYGNDSLIFGAGDDTIYGGDGDDIIDDVAGTQYIGFNMIYAGAGNDSVWAGLGDDSVLGGTGNDSLTGDAGNDTILGGAGNDTLVGGAGTDRLTGGAGADSFVFNKITETAATSARDVILDFALGDKIDLAGIDANGRQSGDQAFSFIGSGAFTALGQLHYKKVGGVWLVEGNTTGNTAADFSIEIRNGFALQASDFVL